MELQGAVLTLGVTRAAQALGLSVTHEGRGDTAMQDWAGISSPAIPQPRAAGDTGR